MRKKNLGNNLVKKAIIGAMIFMMTFTSVAPSFSAVKAAEVTSGTVIEMDGENGQQSVTLTEAETINNTASTDFTDANTALTNAQKKEAIEVPEAILTIGQGIITEETKAILAEGAAKSDLKKAEDTIDAAEEAVATDLATANSKILDGVQQANAADTAATAAKEAADTAADALADANAANTSTAARGAVAEAAEAATTADDEATAAETAADQLQKDLDDAIEAYNAAVEKAAAAEKAANAAIADGAEDAEAAMKDAEDAWKKAESLKEDMDKAEAAAKQNVTEKEAALAEAKAKLSEATTALKEAGVAEAKATVKAAGTGVELGIADLLLYNANQALQAANKAVSDQETAIQNLKDAKTNAETELAKAKSELADDDATKTRTKEEKEALEKQVAALESALSAANSALSAAEQARDDAQAKQDAIKADEFQMGVKSYEEQIAVAKKAQDEKDTSYTGKSVDELTQELAIYIMNNKLGTDAKVVEGTNGQEFQSTDADGIVTYYSYVVNSDGSISIYQDTKTTSYVVDGSKNALTNLTEEEKNAAIEGLAAEMYTITDGTPAQEATYTVTYQEPYQKTTVVNHAGDNVSMSSTALKNMYGGNVPAGVTVTYDKPITYEKLVWVSTWWGGYPSIEKATTTATFGYQWKDGEWKCVSVENHDFLDLYQYVTGSLEDNVTVNVHYGQDVTKTETEYNDVKVEDVKASELGNYTSKTNYSATEKTAAVGKKYNVTYNKAVDSYTKADTASTSQNSVKKVYDDLSNTIEKNAAIANAYTNGGSYTNDNGEIVTVKSVTQLTDEKAQADEDATKAAQDYQDACNAYDKQYAKVQDLQKAYDDRYVTKKYGWIFKKTQYEKELDEANTKLNELKWDQYWAQVAYNAAVKAQEKAKSAHDKAVEELESATITLAAVALEEGKQVLNVAGKELDLGAAKTAYAAAKVADTYATDLEAKAETAYNAAKDAYDAVSALQNTANVAKDELAVAKAKYDKLLAAYEEVEAEAEEAREAADQAANDYQSALNRLAALVAAEQAAAAANEEGGATTPATILTTTPAVVTVPANNNVPAAGNGNGNAAQAAAPVVVDDEATPQAAATEEKADADTTEIADEATPEAAATQNTNWWWLLLLLLIPGGYAVYKNTAKAKENEKED